jgi:hypothetical protein
VTLLPLSSPKKKKKSSSCTQEETNMVAIKKSKLESANILPKPAFLKKLRYGRHIKTSKIRQEKRKGDLVD